MVSESQVPEPSFPLFFPDPCGLGLQVGDKWLGSCPLPSLLCKLSLYLRMCLLSFGVGLGERFQVLLQIYIKAIDLAEPRHVTLE